MSDQPSVPKAVPAQPTPPPTLPAPVVRESSAFYLVPHILMESKDGIVSIRPGGQKQVTFKIETWFSEAEQTKDTLEIKAQNSFNLAGATVDVLNDAGDFNGQTFQETVPPAAKYLAQVGKMTVIKFASTRMGMSNISRHLQRPTLYVNTRTSIVLP